MWQLATCAILCALLFAVDCEARRKKAGATKVRPSAPCASRQTPDQIPNHILRKEDCSAGLFSLGDIEGNYGFWKKFVLESGAFRNAEEHFDDKGGSVAYMNAPPLQLNANTCFVFLGDTLDSAGRRMQAGELKPIAITRALVQLSDANPGRVLLMLGNRDVNKLRLKAELADDADPDDFPYYWLAQKEETLDQCEQAPKGSPSRRYNCQPGWDTGSAIGQRLGMILQESMGAGFPANVIETYREELGVEKNETEVALEVRDTLLAADGWFFKYISRAVFVGAAKFGDEYALFAHAGVDPLMFGTEAGPALFIPAVEYDTNSRTFINKEGLFSQMDATKKPSERSPVDEVYKTQMPPSADVEAWVRGYATWKQAVFRHWADTAPEDQRVGAKPLAMTRPGASLMDAGLGALAGTFRNAGLFVGPAAGQWEYGVNPAANVGSPTFQGWRSPANLAQNLAHFKVKTVVNGHFGFKDQITPEPFKIGAEQEVQVVNLDLTQGDQALWATTLAYAKMTSLAPEIVSKVGEKVIAIDVDKVGDTYPVSHNLLNTLNRKCFGADLFGKGQINFQPSLLATVVGEETSQGAPKVVIKVFDGQKLASSGVPPDSTYFAIPKMMTAVDLLQSKC